MNKIKIKELYERYGFSFREKQSEDDFLAFTYKTGFFNNAELVAICNDSDKINISNKMEAKAKSFSEIGFSVKKSFYRNYDELDNALFEGFFEPNKWNEKTTRHYKDYINNILKSVTNRSARYSYVSSPYKKNGNIIEGNIINDICEIINDSKKPELIIIEAPAGFGKTCTSYEIINNIANDMKFKVPFFAEFSRDRQARIFNHIFISEVDRSFVSVKSSVVLDEVKSGRIVIVLDGFDELLGDYNNSNNKDQSEVFESTEPMLDTISDLLHGKAKIILTSRKAALFDSEFFSIWKEKYENRFDLTRFQIEKPRVKDWIVSDRLVGLQSSGVNIDYLSNPVLLSYLRFSVDSDFSDLLNDPKKIVSYYFDSMLEREQERQNLLMNIDQQKEVLSLIADNMCELNYTHTSRDSIVDFLLESIGPLLLEIRKLYNPTDRPTTDKIAQKLAHHAFLDRSDSNDERIGFINEYVFGNFIAHAVLKKNGEWLAHDERFVEPAVLSFQARPLSEKESLWRGLKAINEFVSPTDRMKFESILMENVSDLSYSNSEIKGLSLSGLNLFFNGSICNSVFIDCAFSKISFDLNNLKQIMFLNCKFYDCVINGLSDSIEFFNCHDNNGFIEKITLSSDEDNNLSSDDQADVEQYILRQMFQKDGSIHRLQFFISNFFNNTSYTKKEITVGLKNLKSKGFLEEASDSHFIAVNKNKISEIKNMIRVV